MAQLGGGPVVGGAETRLVRIEREMNDHGAMTVRVVQTGELRTVVEYESPRLRDRLEDARRGTEMPLRIAPAPGRGNSWVVLRN
ncbi:hypothetical protein GJR96_11935 [Haloferax sp. MBLA0076]|uniref:DUF7999 domain-containing protein n=1 Tax=Haloferax litoreum TaxID=2666140 RepID=A0A6A8GI86_9EURY|nr:MULTISPECIES: hypothetical protein [Haloferax]KAB1194100.1 hypothetical protein Hfx1148_11875 [Haloferax sp. CBA1148]MRX22656.1 hypothetical protein [Haloferax litoreum]